MTRGLRSNIKIDVPLTSTTKLCTHEISHVFTRNKIETKSNFINQVYFYISCILYFSETKISKTNENRTKINKYLNLKYNLQF